MPAPVATPESARTPRPALPRPGKPARVTWDWDSVETLGDLAGAGAHFLRHRAALGRVSLAGSLWAETGRLLPALERLTAAGFITTSSQPALVAPTLRQRLYLTGLLAEFAAPRFVDALQKAGFITLLSTPASTTLSLPPDSSVLSPSGPGDPLSPSPMALPLTLVKQGKSWTAPNAVPLPLPLAELLDLDVDMVMDDGGSLFEHHLLQAVGSLGLRKTTMTALFTSTAALTVIWPAFDAACTEPVCETLVDAWFASIAEASAA